MKYCLLLLSLAVTMLPMSVSAIDPNNITDAERQMIVRNCREAQRTMQRVTSIDPITRVNRGNGYSNMSKLMTALGSRAAYNSYNVPDLVGATNLTQSLRQRFADDYTDYEIALQRLIDIDCVANPQNFYRTLVDVRVKRAVVAADVSDLEGQLDIFSRAMLDLQEQMKARR